MQEDQKSPCCKAKKPVKSSYGVRKTSVGREPGDENLTKGHKQENCNLYY
jgi:hypothetical protein